MSFFWDIECYKPKTEASVSTEYWDFFAEVASDYQNYARIVVG